MMIFSNALHRVKRVTVAAQCREHQTTALDLLEKLISIRFALKELGNVKVTRTRIGSTTDFDGLDALGNAGIKSFFEWLVAKQRDKQTYFHLRP
jgi:hypothetical protein